MLLFEFLFIHLSQNIISLACIKVKNLNIFFAFVIFFIKVMIISTIFCAGLLFHIIDSLASCTGSLNDERFIFRAFDYVVFGFQILYLFFIVLLRGSIHYIVLRLSLREIRNKSVREDNFYWITGIA